MTHSTTTCRAAPRYDLERTYRWNYDHAPEPIGVVVVPEVPGDWTFLGRRVSSPLGIPAGPLLNGRWILYYAELGFDVLTYKTVRGVERECYPLPNLLPVETGALGSDVRQVPASDRMRGSWAVSFGMPSMSPDVWRADVEWTRGRLPRDKVLSVSVVGSVQPGWTLEDLADDYARCARWAIESGADCVETNFSCPNVSTCDGQLYQQPESAAFVANHVRAAIGKAPLIVKIGHVAQPQHAGTLVESLAPCVDALAMTNSVAAVVRGRDGSTYFDGQPRGICGEATRAASIAQVRLFADLLAGRERRMSIIGVGGASTAAHVREYLSAGAEAVHIATAAMVDPLVGLAIRRELAVGGPTSPRG
jgi:dihydroorotate dehydrogenase